MICGFLSFLANVICLSYAFDWGTAPLWIGSGLSLIFLHVIEAGRHRWVYLAIFFGNLLGNLFWQLPLSKSVLYSLLNILEPFLIIRFVGFGNGIKTEFHSINSTLRMLVVSAIVCTFIGFLGSLVSQYGNPGVVFSSQWWVWALDDFTGIIILFPLVEFWRLRSYEPEIELSYWRVFELASMMIVCGFLFFYLIPFAPGDMNFLHYWFWPFPLSLWITLRLTRWKSWLILGSAFVLSAIATRLGYGPLSFIEMPVFRTVEMQLYMSVILVPALLIQSLLGEKNKKLQEIELLFHKAENERKAAEEANAAKTLFVANVSHELRTPLTAILGFCEIVRKQGTKENNEFPFNRIEKNARDLFYLVEDLLQLTSSESAEHAVRFTVFSLEELVTEIRLLCSQQQKSPLVECSIECISDVTLRIRSDYVRITQVISNLLRNAIKFTEQGRIDVNLFVGDDCGKKILRVNVKDTGIGIPQEYFNFIFDPFKQVDQSSTRKHGGTGLGLYISRKIAKTLGGDLKLISSTLTVGTHFEAWFPVQLS